VGERLPHGQRRASHDDREAVVERLRVATGDGRLTMTELDERIDAAYAARTYADLEPLTHDLPDPGTPARVPQPAPGRPATRVTGAPGRRWSVACMGGAERRGRWRVGTHHTATVVMGSVDLDLRDADLEAPVVTIIALAVMGSVDVVVPDDCVLDASGFGLMGGFDDSDKAPPAPPGAPVVRVRGFALMGGIGVSRRPRKGASAQGGLEAGRTDAGQLEAGEHRRHLGHGHGGERGR